MHFSIFSTCFFNSSANQNILLQYLIIAMHNYIQSMFLGWRRSSKRSNAFFTKKTRVHIYVHTENNWPEGIERYFKTKSTQLLHQTNELENSFWLRLNRFAFVWKAITSIPQNVSTKNCFLYKKKSIIIFITFLYFQVLLQRKCYLKKIPTQSLAKSTRSFSKLTTKQPLNIQ